MEYSTIYTTDAIIVTSYETLRSVLEITISTERMNNHILLVDNRQYSVDSGYYNQTVAMILKYLHNAHKLQLKLSIITNNPSLIDKRILEQSEVVKLC